MVVKILALLALLISSSVFADAYQDMAKSQCSTMPMQLFSTMLDRFPKLKKELDGMYNVQLRIHGIKELADAEPGILISQEFDDLFYDFAKTAKNTQITQEQVVSYQKRLYESFNKAKPKFMKECVQVVSKGVKDCKIKPTATQMNAAESVCISKVMEKLGPTIKANMPDAAADHMGAVKADAAFAKAIKENKESKVVSEAFANRFKYFSHSEAILPQMLYECVANNNKVFKDYMISLVKDPKFETKIKNGFVNKESILEVALHNSDLDYFKGLIDAGWLSAQEKAAYAKKVKNPEALKFLK